MKLLMNLVYILIFPGLLFSSVFGLWLAGIDRKILARMQKRVGPPVMQPTYDFFKLMGKETIIPDNAARSTFLLAPYIGLASLIVTVLFIPIAGIQAFGGVADIVVILYLLTIPSLAIMFGVAAALFWLIGAYAPASFLGHFTVFVLACFIGYMVIWNVTPALHTPLMSVTNAISSIIAVGALIQVAPPLGGGVEGRPDGLILGLAVLALTLTAVNMFGGFAVTRRMLAMFRK